ncbi:MAG: adenylate/guanylate cyclase domain-containing protein [Desulfovibrio sp.]|jgi:adenylate cyclase|nr:adenylate/guanylate cyclase domain-containing protein [Desulfovibrio sp.]
MAGGARRISPQGRALLAALGTLCALWLAMLLFPLPFERLELAAFDLRLRLAPRPLPSPDVVLVDIDDATLQRFGSWPLPRSVHARALDALTRCGVSVVAYDIVFRGPAQGQDGPAQDAALEAAMARSGRVVLPVGVALARDADVLRLEPEPDDLPLLPSLLSPGALHVPALLQAERSVAPAARFSGRALGLGHIAALPEADGAYRRMPLFVGFQGRLLPALSLAAVLRHLEGRREAEIDARIGATISVGPGGTDISWNGKTLRIPTSADATLWVNPAAAWGRGFWHLSYVELIDAAESGDATRLAFLRQGLEGKIALVALAASGTTDIKATALSPAEPLATLHANLMSQLLTGANLRAAPAWASWIFAGAFLALAGLAFLRLPVRRFLLAGAGLVLACPAVNTGLFATFGLPLAMAGPTLSTAAAVLALLGHSLLRTAREAARQRRMLEAYFSPSIAAQIMESGEDIMAGRSVDLTVLFADISGFTAMSDHMEPAEVQRLLGEYFEEMTACVFRNQGAVDKFMGDGLMAFFGYPETEGLDSAENARRSALGGVRAAVEMQASLAGLNRRWKSQGRPQLAIRIGLHTGHAIVGDMGSRTRREFSLLGRNVNLAQRLEGAAPVGGILVSARTAALVGGHFPLQPVGPLRLKGFDQEEEALTVDLPGQEGAGG